MLEIAVSVPKKSTINDAVNLGRLKMQDQKMEDQKR